MENFKPKLDHNAIVFIREELNTTKPPVMIPPPTMKEEAALLMFQRFELQTLAERQRIYMAAKGLQCVHYLKPETLTVVRDFHSGGPVPHVRITREREISGLRCKLPPKARSH